MNNILHRQFLNGGFFLVVLFAGSGLPLPALGDDIKEVRYGVIEGRHPTEISGGLFGMGKTPGMAYIISLVQFSSRLEVDSLNISFLVGDCVTVVGKGEETTLARAESQQCTNSTVAVMPHKSTLKAHGAISAACQQARKESMSWPPGLGRRRALLREMMVCGAPVGTDSYSKHPLGQTCAQAWTEVESLPFGPQRATARERAGEKCSR